MKLTHLMTTLAMSVVVFGCASTGTQQATYPTLTVLSDKPFVWDNSKSEAMNVALMAQPAGVGFGVHDSRDGTTVTTGYVHGGTRLIDGALGLATSGIFGAVQMDTLNQSVNKSLDWKPTIVQRVPKQMLIDSYGNISFLNVRKFVAENVKTSIEHEVSKKINWGDTLTLKNNSLSNVTVVIKDMELCSKSLNFSSHEKSHKGYLELNYSQHYLDGKNLVEKHCVLSLKSSIASETDDGNFIITSEIVSGHYFVESLTRNSNAYVLVPDFYEINATDSPAPIKIESKYAYVASAGKKLLFQSP